MKIKSHRFFVVLAALVLSILNAQFSVLRAQGLLTPPGAPAPTMKSLDQIEPRTPITSLPFSITNPGAYYLVATLTGAASSPGIIIFTNDVTIDFKGFALIGVTGSLEGIKSSGTVTNLTISNGTIRNWGAGISLSGTRDCSFQGLHVQNNGNIGISAGAVASVKNCIVEGNLVYGISVGEGSLISGCNVRTNANGIGMGYGSALINCSSALNAGYGIYANSGANIQACVVRGNGGIGIVAQDNSVVAGCSVGQNGSYGVWLNNGVTAGGSIVSGCSITANLNHGIYVTGGGNRITDNVCSYNGAGSSAGIEVDTSGNRIEGNNFVGNQNRGLKVTVGGNFIVRNTASLNTVNYDITGTQTMGPDVTGTGIITTNNPWANFEF
jgi:hypothetical protein